MIDLNKYFSTNQDESKTDFFPLMSNEDEEKIGKESTPNTLAILPLKNTVLFPGVIIPITIGRDKSIKLINDSENSNNKIGVLSQKDPHIEIPTTKDLNQIGTVAQILKTLKMHDGNITAIIQGRKRFKVESIVKEEPYIVASVQEINDKKYQKNKASDALISSVRDLALKIIDESPNIPSEANIALKNIKSSSFLINFVSSNMNIDLETKQSLLEETDFEKRANSVLKYLTKELQILEMKNKIQSKVKIDLDKQQKEYLLNQQLKAIKEELGEGGSVKEIEELSRLASKKKWSNEVKDLFDKELKKLKRMNPSMTDFSIQRSYLELILDLPWNEYTDDNFDLRNSQKILDRDHFGLEEVKDRIIEYLSVLKLKKNMKSPIICLYGPPGVGKTSLGKSIANSLNRKYARISLGGLRDEAEIRGHRKTYIGAMPGRIIKSIKKTNSSNPVFVLDEIDKLTRDMHGDPSSALLEVLDPEQNESFYDNYLEIGYDLSKVLFIATANSLAEVHPALRDRMEIIEINGYTVEEKIQIAKRHLIPKQISNHGIKKSDINLTTKTIEKIIDSYTKESGVRTLEKVIAKVTRYVAKSIATDQLYIKSPNLSEIEIILGPPKYLRSKSDDFEIPGVVTGLAWTKVGGDILFIESILSKGKGKMSITGNLGKVMKESATIALQYLKSNCKAFKIDFSVFENWDIHIHVPEGATPKDGPSAGITIFTSLLSIFSQRKIKKSFAMTGEITLRGRVTAVGGIKEKILAAKRSGYKNIILSDENKKDVHEIKAEYLKGLKFYYISSMNEISNLCLEKEKYKNYIDL